jgi:two-component system, LytTR family, sensor kinase
VRRSLRAATIVIACATLFALLENIQNAVRLSTFGQPYDWALGLREGFTTWIGVAALTPLVLALARRFPIERRRLPRRLLLHLGASLAFGVAGSLIATTSAWIARDGLSFPLVLTKIATWYTLFFAAVYWGVIAAGHALTAAQLREQLTRERLEVLRGKLNPHFLFNTLNAISTMALQRDHEGVAQSLGLVGDLLRVSLDDTLPQEVPLARELEFTDKYLAVQRLRFGDRLAIERDVDPRALEALVPSMLLQPLVENAVVHGVAATPGPGSVRISAAADDGWLHIAVADSGPGFAGEVRNGIGLAGTRERLATLYGGKATIDIGAAEGGGAMVTICIPRGS